MLFFRTSARTAIDAGAEEYRKIPGAILLDVRTQDEYATGHLPGSINLPVDEIGSIVPEKIPDRQTPLFFYCRSGARSRRALDALQRLGYRDLHDLGGILNYHGTLEENLP